MYILKINMTKHSLSPEVQARAFATKVEGENDEEKEASKEEKKTNVEKKEAKAQAEEEARMTAPALGHPGHVQGAAVQISPAGGSSKSYGAPLYVSPIQFSPSSSHANSTRPQAFARSYGSARLQRWRPPASCGSNISSCLSW